MLVRPALAGRWTFTYTVAAAIAVACMAASIVVAPNARGVCGAGLALLVGIIAAVDARHFVIPDELNVTALVLAFIDAGIGNYDAVTEAIFSIIIGGSALSLAFLGLRAAYRRLRQRDGLGLGDVKLAGVAGAWLDWPTIPIAIEIAALTALAAYMIRRYASASEFRPTSRLPFGLFFAPAIWLGWFLEILQLAPT
jgi:leader peptidase (prepilin peptidase)/N-methyltransferase